MTETRQPEHQNRDRLFYQLTRISRERGAIAITIPVTNINRRNTC